MRYALVVVVLLSGCSGDGNWMPKDVQQNQSLQELGSTGYQRVCDAFEDYIRDKYRTSYLVQAVCTYHGVKTTQNASECGKAVQACTAKLPPEAEGLLQTILAQASCSAVSIEPTGCAATVAQLKACLDGLERKLDTLKFTLTCSAAGQPIDESWWRITMPEACQAIRRMCPR